MSQLETEPNEAIKKYIDQMREVYELTLIFIDNLDQESYEESYRNLLQSISSHEIDRNSEMFDHFIKILVHISNNHHRQPRFFEKIERILINYQDSIKENKENIEIFEQFESNKRLVYFLIKEHILTIDEEITKAIEGKIEMNGKRYSDFFIPEITPKDNKNNEMVKYCSENLSEYEEKRLIGENDSYICTLIRQDSIEEFVSFLNQKNLDLSSKIEPSVFETNSFLIENEPSLIEYAAFFGSIQIYNYLFSQKVQISQLMWMYGIHSNCAEIVQNFLENNKINPPNEKYIEPLFESIKCHHNEIALYIQENLIDNVDEDEIVSNAFKYQNYSYIPSQLNENNAFFYLSNYDYITIVELLLQKDQEKIENQIINI